MKALDIIDYENWWTRTGGNTKSGCFNTELYLKYLRCKKEIK